LPLLSAELTATLVVERNLMGDLLPPVKHNY
jgi:hypothetical protein